MIKVKSIKIKKGLNIYKGKNLSRCDVQILVDNTVVAWFCNYTNTFHLSKTGLSEVGITNIYSEDMSINHNL